MSMGVGLEKMKEAAFTFRQGTEITKGKVKTGYVEETNPEWFKSIDVSDTAITFVSGNRIDTEGTVIVDTFALQRDENGRITQITDSNGNITVITRS